VKNVLIRNNRFLGNHLRGNKNGMIHAWIFGDEKQQSLKHIHQNITVHRNLFEDATLPIYLSMTDGVTVTDNLFVNQREEKDTRILIRGCTNVHCKGNYTLCGAEKFESVPFEGDGRAVDTPYLNTLVIHKQKK